MKSYKSKFVLGTWPLSGDYGRYSEKNLIEVLNTAIDNKIHEIDTVFKLSQDRDYESYQNIINHLKVKDESARVIAQEMEKRKIKLFQNNQ